MRRSPAPAPRPRQGRLAATTLAVMSAAAFFPPVTAAEEYRAGGTQVWPRAWRAWEDDTRRETLRERNYWQEFRLKEKARLLGIERARTARILNAVRARAAAFRAFDTKPRQNAAADAPASGGQAVSFPQPDGWPAGTAALSRAKETAKRKVDDAATTVVSTAKSMAETIGESLSSTKNSASKTAGVIVALLVIFLAPAVFLVLLALGVIRIRKRRNLFPRR